MSVADLARAKRASHPTASGVGLCVDPGCCCWYYCCCSWKVRCVVDMARTRKKAPGSVKAKDKNQTSKTGKGCKPCVLQGHANKKDDARKRDVRMGSKRGTYTHGSLSLSMPTHVYIALTMPERTKKNLGLPMTDTQATASSSTPSTVPMPRDGDIPAKPRGFGSSSRWCSHCEHWYNSDDQFQKHTNGRKHKKTCADGTVKSQ